MAWDSKKGDLIESSNEDYLEFFMNFFNSSQGKTTSYKFCLVKCILDNLFNCSSNLVLTFDQLNASFLKIYWNIICKYNLPQSREIGRLSKIEDVIYQMKNKFESLDEYTDYDILPKMYKNLYIKKAKSIFSQYVVGALYDDLQKKIYGFDKKEKIIYFNQKSFNFLIEKKCVIEKLNYYSWIVWMENKLNREEKEIANISSKLDKSTERKSLEEFKKELFINDEENCFYCNKKITKNNCHVDHFIPWSFVKDDKIWNFVLSCSSCNLSKSDKIPSENYLDKIIKRNYEMFGNLYTDKVKLLYKSALKNGFERWNKENN